MKLNLNKYNFKPKENKNKNIEKSSVAIFNQFKFLLTWANYNPKNREEKRN